MENRIEKVWFEDSKIFIRTISGDVLNQSGISQLPHFALLEEYLAK